MTSDELLTEHRKALAHHEAEAQKHRLAIAELEGTVVESLGASSAQSQSDLAAEGDGAGREEIGANTFRNILVDMADALDAFATALDEGPSGWLVMPLLARASQRMKLDSIEEWERTRGALYAILYGTPIEITKRGMVVAIRSTVELLRTQAASEDVT